MRPTDARSQGTRPLPASHPLPQRTSSENSVTLRQHQLARDASLRATRGSGPPNRSNAPSSSRRDSSGESNRTGQSDAKKWFDQSNENPTATFDANAMDADPPFYQKESDSSNESKSLPCQRQLVPPKRTAHSSSADDYRSVIDDLTIENQKLKEELKRYKQRGPDLLRKEKLFEIKVHGLPSRKKRELEAALRDFAAGLEDSPNTSSSQRKSSSRHANRDHMYSGSGSMSMSKQASSSSGSNIRPVDSAYASISIGAHSAGAKSLGPPFAVSRAKSSEQKVESYLRDIPEGLYPRYRVMTEKERKKLVVRRLEQIFTGKMSDRQARRVEANRPPGTSLAPPAGGSTGAQPSPQQPVAQQSGLEAEPAREAQILPHELSVGQTGKNSRSQDMGSASNSNGDQTESGGNGNGNSAGLGTNASPQMPPPPEQRPTRPKDLDPDRVQIPSENMEYIRHLGLVPPELKLPSSNRVTDDVHPDADGWVYLNLLCNMAQLHMMNVTPDFVRSAVADLSAKFQLSPDGRKIRWRGGTEGTKFHSDSSEGSSQRSPETDDMENSNKDDPRKRQKTGLLTGDDFQSGSSGKNMSKFVPQNSGSSDSLHYKPLFAHRSSSNEQLSMEDDTMSSFAPVQDSWDQSGSGASNRRKRRHDGAIIYYSGAPFCTDLSGDPGDSSPVTYMLSSGQPQFDAPAQFAHPPPVRSEPGAPLNCHPLSDLYLGIGSGSNVEMEGSGNSDEVVMNSGDDCSDVDMEFPWSNEQQYIDVHPLEPCGLGGVLPEDHFMVVVTTRRPRLAVSFDDPKRVERRLSEEMSESIINCLATMSTSLSQPRIPRPSPLSRGGSQRVKIEYLSGRIKRLVPEPLPPPAIFFPPFSSTDSFSDDDESGSDGDDEFYSSEEFMSRRANLHQSVDYPDGVDLSSGDEDGDEPNDEPDISGMYAQRGSGAEEGLSDGHSTQDARPSSGSSEAAAAAAAAGTIEATVRARR